MSDQTTQLVADFRMVFRRMFTWPETYAALTVGALLVSFFVAGAVKDALLKEGMKRLEDVKIQTERANTDMLAVKESLGSIRADLKNVHDQNSESRSDRKILNQRQDRYEDSVRRIERALKAGE